MALFRLKKDTDDLSQENAPKGEGKSVSKDTVASKTIKKTKATDKAGKKPSSDVLSLNYRKDTASVLKNPRVTEKATIMSENGVYVFDVSTRATKADVRDAVKELYKVTPRKINIVKVPSKRVRIRGRQNKFGVKSGGKKAYVYVKKGDTIDIV